MRQVALITGGAKRLGREMALMLAKAGWDIALHFRSSAKEAEKTKQEITHLGQRCLVIQGDLCDAVFVSSLIDRVCDALGGLTLLINNASIFKKVGFQDSDESLFDQNIALHLKSPFFLSQTFARRCGKGAIINMLDTRVSRYDCEHFIYTLTKKALKELTLLLAKELAPKIRVNGICPGAILPPEALGDAYLKTVAAKTPMKRPGTLDDILSAVQYLVQSEYVTGEILFVDGGEHLI